MSGEVESEWDDSDERLQGEQTLLEQLVQGERRPLRLSAASWVRHQCGRLPLSLDTASCIASVTGQFTVTKKALNSFIDRLHGGVSWMFPGRGNELSSSGGLVCIMS